MNLALFSYFSGVTLLEALAWIILPGSVLLLIQIAAVMAAGAGVWWYILPVWLRAESDGGSEVSNAKTMMRSGLILWIAASFGYFSSFNIARGVFGVSLPYPEIQFRGVLSFVGTIAVGAGAIFAERKFQHISHGGEIRTSPWTRNRILKRLGEAMLFVGAYSGVFGTQVALPALILLVGGVLAYLIGRFTEHKPSPSQEPLR